MGSFNFRDFITDLPILTNNNKSLYTLIVGQQVDTGLSELEIHNLPRIDGLIKPFSFPFFGYYDDYGQFILDNEKYKRENTFAKEFLQARQVDVIEEDTLDNNALKEKGLLLMATATDIYHESIYQSNLHEQEFYFNEETYAEHVKNLLQKGMQEVNAFDPEDHNFNFPEFFRPDIEGFGMLPLEATFTMARHLEKEAENNTDIITNYLLDWFCFFYFLQIVGKPFKPIANLGGQNDQFEYYHLLKKLEYKQALKLHASYDELDEEDEYMSELD